MNVSLETIVLPSWTLTDSRRRLDGNDEEKLSNEETFLWPVKGSSLSAGLGQSRDAWQDGLPWAGYPLPGIRGFGECNAY